jgi:hypothetical protein
VTLSIQFHALPGEHVGLLAGALADTTLWVSEHRIDAPAFRHLDRRDGTPSLAGTRSLIFTLREPDLGASTMHQFAGLNPDALVLEIGTLSETGLGESHLWSNSLDPSIIRRWRDVAKPLRAALFAGSVAFNPVTGKSGPMKWHRFTRKAQEAHHGGLVLRPVAGSSVIILPEM